MVYRIFAYFIQGLYKLFLVLFLFNGYFCCYSVRLVMMVLLGGKSGCL